MNGSKTRSMVIASSKKDQQWDPKLKAEETPIKLEQEYPFLGVEVPSDIRFNGHVQKMVTKGRKRNRVLKCMSGKNWGNTRETQRTIYVQYVRTAMTYASPSWTPWISETNMKALQRTQNDALRTIMGSAATCPTDFLHLDANIEPIRERLIKNDQLLRQRYMRLPRQDPRRKLAEKKGNIRLKTRLGWREKTKPKETDKEYCIEEIKPPLEPWRRTNLKFDAVTLAKPKNEHSKEELKKKTDEKLAEMKADIMIWTDGSTNANQERGGAGVFVEDKRTGTTEKLSFAAGEICSSFGAEGVAMLRALEWLEEHPVGETIICTDSLSVHAALEKDNWKDAQDWIRKIKLQSRKMAGQVTILWVPSHCGVEGNEEADRLAEIGTKLDQKETPITQAIAYAKVKKKIWKITHKRAKTIFQEKFKPKLEIEKKWPRRVQSMFSRLRSGHCKELKQYRYKIDVEDDPWCECGEVESIEHVLCDCPILDEIRRRVIEEPVEPHHLVTKPEEARTILAKRFENLKLEHDFAEIRDDEAPLGAR